MNIWAMKIYFNEETYFYLKRIYLHVYFKDAWLVLAPVRQLYQRRKWLSASALYNVICSLWLSYRKVKSLRNVSFLRKFIISFFHSWFIHFFFVVSTSSLTVIKCKQIYFWSENFFERVKHFLGNKKNGRGKC